jgi:hypothetical protein
MPAVSSTQSLAMQSLGATLDDMKPTSRGRAPVRLVCRETHTATMQPQSPAPQDPGIRPGD